MKLSKEEFEKLQAEWYDKIKVSGFYDVELEPRMLPEPPQSRSMPKFKSKPTEKILSIRLPIDEYYARVREQLKLLENANKLEISPVHLFVIKCHANGLTICKIKEELQKIGLYRCRNALQKIIERYLSKWKIKTKWPKQTAKVRLGMKPPIQSSRLEDRSSQKNMKDTSLQTG